MLSIQADQAAEGDDKPSLVPWSSAEDNQYFNLKLYNRDSDLLVIHEAAKLISLAETPEYAINGILRMMSEMLGLNRGRVLLPLDDGTLAIRYNYGLRPEEQQRGVYHYGEGITGKVMKTGQMVLIENIDDEPGLLFRAVKRKTLPQEMVSYIALPIMHGNTPIGVLATHRIRSRLRPFDADLVILRTFATFISQILQINKLNEEKDLNSIERSGGKDINAASFDDRIMGESLAIQRVFSQVHKISHAPVSVLLSGESGTGKERFANLIHQQSGRNDKPFVAINCAAIPEQLLESELFGHERGSFTGAVARKQGKFELANGGTLFLDEIGDLSLELQTKLLRVLETKSIQRVGGVKDTPVDVRIVTATHKNLMQAVNEEKFRLDLFYRLNVFPIHLPPLRSRHGDISILSRHFLSKAVGEFGRPGKFEQGVLERLESYNWPGNIRQLDNVVKRALLSADNGKIGVHLIESILASESYVHVDLEAGQPFNSAVAELMHDPSNEFSAVEAAAKMAPLKLKTQHDASKEQQVFDESDRRSYNWVNAEEADHIHQALLQAKGNKTRAAKLLGMTCRQLRYRIKKLDIV